MCGIAGSIHFKDKSTGERTLDALKHRGPDDRGDYWDEQAQVFLGHQRLSIIDLSPAGHQPMSDEAETLWVTFNGELYNYKVLRHELEALGCRFRSKSDTEVLIHGYAKWGADIFKKIDGMWAVGLYDKKNSCLLLSRDPAGIKPLYIYKKERELLFASEIGALAGALPKEALTTKQSAVEKYLAHGYLYGADTIYQEVRVLAPGVTAAFELSTMEAAYIRNYVPREADAPPTMSIAVEAFEKFFADSVEESLQSDVPIGLFLSGGIDSSLVGYYAQQAGASLQSFTVGFKYQSFDESARAARIAKHLGFPHEIVMLSGTEVAEDLERILDSFGEPFADMAAVPLYYLSKHARERGYKVILTGDGADELFGGYQTHYLPALARLYRTVPSAADTMLSAIAGLLPNDFSKLGTKEKLSRFLHGAREPYEAAHALWKRVFTDAQLRLLLPGRTLQDLSFEEFFRDLKPGTSAADAVMALDFMTFLPSSCLVKSDICPMQSGLEVRVPFLNKKMLDFAHSLPAQMKASPFQTKKLLRAALAHSLPRDITRQPKQGFVPPMSQWLSEELKPAMLSILSRESIDKVGFLNYDYVASLIERHLERSEDNAKKLWALMSLVRFFSTHTHGQTIFDSHTRLQRSGSNRSSP